MSCRARRLPAPEPPGYYRRRPEETVLYEALRSHLASFLERCDESGPEAALPAHVRGEFERFLTCGILAHGFVRVRCQTCRDDLLVAFSCRGRGFCPSCGGRRMADTAARWGDRVLPRVPWRQWVLSLPFPLRFRLAWDPELLSEVLAVFQSAIAMRLRAKARRRGLRGARHASVTVIQRFGGAINLNVHFHSLVADGVWVMGASGPRFEPLRVDEEDVRWVVGRVWRRSLRLLRERGVLRDDEEEDHQDELLPESRQLELRLMDCSVQGRIALGVNAGQRVRAQGRRLRRRSDAPRSRRRMQSFLDGFDLQAAVRVPASDRHRLEHISRYLLRPAIATERLELLDDGIYRYELKRPWSDGTQAFLFEPLELMEKLAALVPIPRANLVRYHGVLAPASTWRAAVVPSPAEESSPPHCGTYRPLVPTDRVPWAWLLRRVFLIEVLRCARCGGRRQIVGPVTEPAAIPRILRHLGIPAAAPRLDPARAPPELDSWAS